MDESDIPKRVIKEQVTQDVELWIKNGGKVKLIPPSYKPPTRYMVYIEDEYF